MFPLIALTALGALCPQYSRGSPMDPHPSKKGYVPHVLKRMQESDPHKCCCLAVDFRSENPPLFCVSSFLHPVRPTPPLPRQCSLHVHRAMIGNKNFGVHVLCTPLKSSKTINSQSGVWSPSPHATAQHPVESVLRDRERKRGERRERARE